MLFLINHFITAMKILIAPDSFKNALSALKVADSIKKGLLKALPAA